MAEVQVQSPQQQQQQQPAELLQLRDSVEPIDLSMLHLNAAAAGCHHHHHPNPPCAAAYNGSSGSNSMKRRSPATSSGAGAGAGERCAKKLFCDQEDLTLRGFSAVSLPMSLGALAGKSAASGRPCCPVLRRCVSDPYRSPAPAGELPECVAGGGTPPPARGSGLPPLPPSLRRSVSDVTPSPPKVLSRSLSSEETTPDSSMKLRRMKDCLREMKQRCDEVLKDAEEEEEEELDEGAVAEDDKVPPQDELGGDSEEAVSVEWADKCLSLTFRCPCGKGYEVLLSENNCYYKLV